MKVSISKRILRFLRYTNQWLVKTPERALEQAYEAALMIKAIEDEHFNGQRIDPANQFHSARMQNQFQDDLKTNLRIARIRLQEFRTSRALLGLSDQRILRLDYPASLTSLDEDTSETSSAVIEQLLFIDQVLERYDPPPEEEENARSLVPLNLEAPAALGPYVPGPPRDPDLRPSPTPNLKAETANSKPKTRASSTSFVPRSILGTIDRLRRELDPRAEEEVVKKFRSSKTKTVISIKFILLLILVPLLVHQIARNFVIGPLIDQQRSQDPTAIFLNLDMEEEALAELQRFESELDFLTLINVAPPLTADEKVERIHKKAEEIAIHFRERSTNAVKNVFADICSVFSFVLVMLLGKKDLAVFKSFIDEIIYGLSDSAKAFIIILFTDMFVGFHSPHGWEVLLEGVSRHLGLPESRDFIFLFIATFPVILDTVFKYWIFRYLNRISPSAVATYRNMNE